MELLIIVAGVSVMYVLAVWVRRAIRSEMRRVQKAEADKLFGNHLDMKYLADVSGDQKEEWRTSRWD